MKKIILLILGIVAIFAVTLVNISFQNYYKYLFLAIGIVFGFFAEILDKDKKRNAWLFLKIAHAICIVVGIMFIIKDDEVNTDNFNTIFYKTDSIFQAQSDSFNSNNNRLKGILNNITSFQQRQFNPLPDSCYFMFDVVIDYSKLDVKSKITNKKLSRIEGKDSLFSFEFPSRGDVISNYIRGMDKSIVLTFENKFSKIKYYVEYDRSPEIESRYCNQKDEMIFRYNLVPTTNFSGDWDFLDLKMIKSASHNFISTLDFENCTVKMCFGTLTYDRYTGRIGDLKARIDNARVLLDFDGVDFIEVKNIKQLNNEPLSFIGKTTKLTINTLRDDCLSPLYYGNQQRRGRR